MTDKKAPKDIAQPRPLSLVAEEPAMLGAVPVAAKPRPPTMGGPEVAGASVEGDAASLTAKRRAEEAERAAAVAKIDEELTGAANELTSAGADLDRTMRALADLLDAMPK